MGTRGADVFLGCPLAFFFGFLNQLVDVFSGTLVAARAGARTSNASATVLLVLDKLIDYENGITGD